MTTAVFTHHHLLLDGWSLPFVLETVFEAYEALVAGRPLPHRAASSLRPYAAWRPAAVSGPVEPGWC